MSSNLGNGKKVSFSATKSWPKNHVTASVIVVLMFFFIAL